MIDFEETITHGLSANALRSHLLEGIMGTSEANKRYKSHSPLCFPSTNNIVIDRHKEASCLLGAVEFNLDTHTSASLYETFPPAEARRILHRLEFHYNPKHGSWLKMAEIESPFSSAMRRQVTTVEQSAMYAASWSGSIR